jgi:glycosyltransferase involved in cell wall biosynthesis
MLAFFEMSKPPISVTLITLNEERNIARALESVRWADDVVVVDSGSTDRTLEIAKASGARVFQNAWKGYGQQKNFAQAQARHDWVLNIDADEVVPAELAREIQARVQSAETRPAVRGFSIPRLTWYLGRWIRHGGWYPNYLVRLADRRHARWTEPNVHEALEVQGETEKLEHPLHHYAFSGISDQVQTNLRYSRQGYLDLVGRGRKPSPMRLVLKPIGKFFETYLIKKGFLDGRAGFIISVNAAHSMFLKYAYFYEDRSKELK